MADPEQVVEVIVAPNGSSRHLVEKAAEGVGESFGEPQETWRNSHVETWSSLPLRAKWWLVCKGKLTWSFLFPFTADAKAEYRELATKWWADMTPIKGPVLGPYKTQGEALAAEIKYLKDHDLPTPRRWT